MTVRLVLADPRDLVRGGLAAALGAHRDLEVVATVETVDAAVLQAQRTQPDVVVVTAALRGSLRRLCEQCVRLHPQPRTLLLDGDEREEALLEAVEAGTDGYVSGVDGVDGLAEAVRSLARGEAVIPASMLGPLLRRLIERRRRAAAAAERLIELTPREREVLELLADGAGQMEIAAALVISPETARTHVQRILRKLDVHSRREAVELVADLRTNLGPDRTGERAAS